MLLCSCKCFAAKILVACACDLISQCTSFLQCESLQFLCTTIRCPSLNESTRLALHRKRKGLCHRAVQLTFLQHLIWGEMKHPWTLSPLILGKALCHLQVPMPGHTIHPFSKWKSCTPSVQWQRGNLAVDSLASLAIYGPASLTVPELGSGEGNEWANKMVKIPFKLLFCFLAPKALRCYCCLGSSRYKGRLVQEASFALNHVPYL